MIKLLLGFIVFAALAIWVLTKAGGNIDMGGEKHGVESHAPAASEAAPAASAAPAAASAPASAASM